MIGALLKWVAIGLLTFVIEDMVLDFIFEGRFNQMIRQLKWLWLMMDMKDRLIWILESIAVILLCAVIWPIALMLSIMKDYRRRDEIRENIKNGF